MSGLGHILIIALFGTIYAASGQTVSTVIFPITQIW
jgi:hypothetical protein